MASITHSQTVPPHLLSQAETQASNPDSPPSQTTSLKPRDILATFHYYKDPPDGSAPAPTYVDKPETQDRISESVQLTVHDVRGSEDKYNLDNVGFQHYKHESVEKDFVDEERIKTVYYSETEELLKKVTGATKIFIFDHTIRRQPSETPKNDTDGSTISTPTLAPDTNSGPSPIQRVHIDQTPFSAPRRVKHHLPHSAPTLLQHRYQILNLWRPIRPILKDPLAVMAFPSLHPSEHVPIRVIYPHLEGEVVSVRAAGKDRRNVDGDGGHKWYYLDRQGPGEVLIFKCFESEGERAVGGVPHCSFVDGERVGEAARESIEVRALVFYGDDLE